MYHLSQFMGAGDGTQGFLCDRQSTKCHTPQPVLLQGQCWMPFPQGHARGGREGMGWGILFPPLRTQGLHTLAPAISAGTLIATIHFQICVT